MISLHTIDLSNNKLPIFPEALVYLEQLSTIIYSQEHGIHIDKLPDDIVHLYNLRNLDLSHNTFYEIPQMIYTLTKLEYLNMSYNLLTALETNRLKQFKNLKQIKLNGNNFPSFPSILYQFETFEINENSMCLAPPNDFISDKNISARSNLFVQLNDQYEEKLFQIYKQIFIENLSNSDLQRFLIRLKLSEKDITHFRKNYHHHKREEKLEILFRIWKEKRDSLANSDTLYYLTQLIGDKKLSQQMQKAYLLARRIRI
jgi:Leucine-rich repeat (LRR) protein